MNSTQTADFVVENHGTIFLVRPETHAAKQWVAAHIPDDAQRWGIAVVVEHRFVQDIIEGILKDGLEVQ